MHVLYQKIICMVKNDSEPLWKMLELAICPHKVYHYFHILTICAQISHVPFCHDLKRNMLGMHICVITMSRYAIKSRWICLFYTHNRIFLTIHSISNIFFAYNKLQPWSHMNNILGVLFQLIRKNQLHIFLQMLIYCSSAE